MTEQLIFGADPETFAARFVDGKPFVVPPVLFRTDYGVSADMKNYRHPVFKEIGVSAHDSVKIIEDGVAFELTVTPQKDLKSLFKLIQVGYTEIGILATKYGHSLCTVPTINFDIQEFAEREEEIQQCTVFGCDPDLDVFSIIREQMEESALEHPFRYGGGHIHISGSKFLKEMPEISLRIIAATVGNFVTANSPFPKLDHQRVYRYGRPGRYRVQNYGSLWENIPNTDIGIEYRTPSNAWTTKEEMLEGIEYWIRIAVDKILPSEQMIKEVIFCLEENTISAVMNFDSKLAERNLAELDAIVN